MFAKFRIYKCIYLSIGQGAASADVSKSAGYVGTAVLYLEEKNSTNQTVAKASLQYLANFGSQNQGLTYTLSETSKAADDIQYVTFSGASNDENNEDYSVDITYMASRHAGLVGGEGVNGVPVVPKSIESIVTINNYPYQSPSNYISLVLAVATEFADVSKSGQLVYDANKTVYFSVSKNVYLSGNVGTVDISTFESGDFDEVGNSDFQQQVTAKYGAKAAIKYIKVAFPPGATNIVYDPSIGTGVAVQDSSQSSSSLVSPLLSMVFFMAVYVLF